MFMNGSVNVVKISIVSSKFISRFNAIPIWLLGFFFFFLVFMDKLIVKFVWTSTGFTLAETNPNNKVGGTTHSKIGTQ